MTEPELDLDARKAGIQIEAKLVAWTVPYEYVPAFPIGDLKNPEWAQVRVGENLSDKETLAQFRTQMSGGAVFPPLVVMAPDVLVDGNHRVFTAKSLRHKTFPAFVCRFTTVDLARAFAASANQTNGRRLTAAEAYVHAVTMMSSGMAENAIAIELGYSATTIREMRNRRDFEARSAAIGPIKELAERIPQNQRAKLAQITHNPAFAEAVKLVAETKAPARIVGELVAAVKAARSDSEGIEAVRSIAAELAPAGPPPIKITIPPELRQLRAHLGGLVHLSNRVSLLMDVSDEKKREAAIENWRIVRELADKMLANYGQD